MVAPGELQVTRARMVAVYTPFYDREDYLFILSLKPEPEQAYSHEKAAATAWVGLQIGEDRA